MKQNLKLIIAALICVAVTYSACKKTTESHSKSTVSAKVVSSRIAQNLGQALYGIQGGFNISDGIDFPSNLDMAHKGRLKVQSQGDHPDCGFKIDTAFQLSLDLSDTAKIDLWTKIKYEVLCTNGVLSGVAVYDTLNASATSSQYIIATRVGENITLKSLSPGNSQAKLTLDGTLNVFASLQPKTGKEKPTTGSFNFKFTALTIDPKLDGDIISGSATFATNGSDATGTWDYKGSITFIGDHKAKITIDGVVYTTDLLTGEVL